jgi:aspartate oxidase
MDGIINLETDVLVAGGGAAGMFAAIAAARRGAQVILLDKNVVGRGGASIMAQMTCAAALGEAGPDNPELHLQDTLQAGRGLCNENLSALLCEGSPQRIRELEGWKVNWARAENGKIDQVKAPGHSRKRCVYVDFLSTGAAQQGEPQFRHPAIEQCQHHRCGDPRRRGNRGGRLRCRDLGARRDQSLGNCAVARGHDENVPAHDIPQ